jgi:hypothetical protein
VFPELVDDGVSMVLLALDDESPTADGRSKGRVEWRLRLRKEMPLSLLQPN